VRFVPSAWHAHVSEPLAARSLGGSVAHAGVLPAEPLLVSAAVGSTAAIFFSY
jgi:hypothetical protein